MRLSIAAISGHQGEPTSRIQRCSYHRRSKKLVGFSVIDIHVEIEVGSDSFRRLKLVPSETFEDVKNLAYRRIESSITSFYLEKHAFLSFEFDNEVASFGDSLLHIKAQTLGPAHSQVVTEYLGNKSSA